MLKKKVILWFYDFIVSQQATVEVCRIAQMPLQVTEVRKSFLAGVHTTAKFSSGKITLILGKE